MSIRIFLVTLNAACYSKKQKHNVRSNTIVNSSFISEMGTRCSFNNLRCVSEEFMYRKWYANDLFFLCCFTCTLNINKKEWTKLSEILNLIKIFTAHVSLFLVHLHFQNNSCCPLHDECLFISCMLPIFYEFFTLWIFALNNTRCVIR